MCKKDFTERFFHKKVSSKQLDSFYLCCGPKPGGRYARAAHGRYFEFWNYELLLDSTHGFQNFKKKD
jgi:hypothetical protein